MNGAVGEIQENRVLMMTEIDEYLQSGNAKKNKLENRTDATSFSLACS
jgi:hypothetical protein